MQTEQLPDRITHAVEGLRSRASDVADVVSVRREIASVTRRIETAESVLSDRIDDVERSLSGQLDALATAGARTSWPRRMFWLLVGAGVAVGAAYLADPDRGRARRTQLRDQAAARTRDVTSEAKKKARWAAGRAKGEVIEAAKEPLPEHVPDDPNLLQDRIKSQAFGGRDDVQDVVLKIEGPGTVTVKGTVPSPDSERELLAQVAEVEGVIDVRSELAVRSG